MQVIGSLVGVFTALRLSYDERDRVIKDDMHWHAPAHPFLSTRRKANIRTCCNIAKMASIFLLPTMGKPATEGLAQACTVVVINSRKNKRFAVYK